MSGFSEESLERKLSELNNSQQSIQQLSLWLIHHRKHYAPIVKVWLRELGKTTNSRKLTFLYLANDVVQNARKKAPEFSKEFGDKMVQVLEHMAATKLDEKTVKATARLLKIWSERSIFDAKIQAEMSKIWNKKALETADEESEPRTPPLPEPPAAKKSKKDKKERNRDKEKSKSKEHKESSKEQQKHQGNGKIEDMPEFKSLMDTLAPSSGEPPKPEDLVKAITDLESSASADARVRERIASLPPEISDSSSIEKLQSAEEARQLLSKIVQAEKLLDDYNEKLQSELKERKRVGQMIVDFLASQNDLLAQAEERLETYRDKLDKVNAIRDDLKSHIQSLPDLTKLPDVTGGLAPLPSAGDLFMK